MYNAEILEKNLPNIAVYVFDSLDSTSGYLKRKSIEGLQTSLCVTHNQTEGYGQRGSVWISDSKALTFSVVLPIKSALNNLNGLSQLVALTLQQRLSLYTSDQIKLKWPNDLFVGDAKVGGMLIEVCKHSIEETWVVIGVGINIGYFNKKNLNYNTAGINVDIVDRNQLLSDLVQHLITLSKNFSVQVWPQQIKQWQQSDLFEMDEEVFLLTDDIRQRFYYVGISDSGELMLSKVSIHSAQFSNEHISYFNSGSVSLRRMEWMQ